MGLTQKGRSRTWLDDHGWWLCVVEFQPSDWSRGTYLNVGCCWLWQVKSYLSFDEGHRAEGFTGFENVEQFSPVSDQLAHHAAELVCRYRKMFANVEAVARYYIRSGPEGFWQKFNAAVACALADQSKDAHRQFSELRRFGHDSRDWVVAALSDAKHLDSIADDIVRFRDIVLERVRRTRELLKLPGTAIQSC